MIRIPFKTPCVFELPKIDFSEADLLYLNQFDQIHSQEMIYRTYKYPTANKISFHSAKDPIDVRNDDADFLSIDNFFELLPASIQKKFHQYFTEIFYEKATSKSFRGIRLYLNKPNAQGVHIHKDIYSGGGTPRQAAINIPVSRTSLESDLRFYDDELNLVKTTRYLKNTPTVINTSVFHEVFHNSHEEVRKIITISTQYSFEEIVELFHRGEVVRNQKDLLE